MPIAVHPNPSFMAETMSSTQQAALRTPLKRATYIHVSDLTSAYNIDHLKLEQELSRVKSGEVQTIPQAEEADSSVVTPVGSGSGDGDASLASVPTAQQKRLQPPRGGYNLCLLVGEVKVVVDKYRVDRSRVRLAEVQVGDETGCVSLRARDEQIDFLQELSKKSGAVVLRNCTIELFQGKHIRLAVTKWGKLTPYPDQVASTPPPPSKMNEERKFSLIDLSLVANEMVGVDSPSTERDAGVENRGPSGSSRASGSNRSQQFQQQGTSYSQSRKQGRDRRQHRQKPVYSHQPYYSDSGMSSRVNPIYQGIHGFSHSYGEAGMDVSHLQYSQPSQHRSREGVSQHLLLQQQYEIQQRQMQQMQAYHEQQERHHHQQGHQIQQAMLPPSIVPATSFDTTGDYSTEPHRPMHMMGGSPMLVGVPIPSGRATTSPMISPGGGRMEGSVLTQSEPRGSSRANFSRDESGRSGQEAWGNEASPSGAHFLSSRSDSPMSLSPGQMNPSAQAFAPGFVHQPGQQPPAQTYAYVTYNPSQGSTPIYASTQPSTYNQQITAQSNIGSQIRESSRNPSPQEEEAKGRGSSHGSNQDKTNK